MSKKVVQSPPSNPDDGTAGTPQYGPGLLFRTPLFRHQLQNQVQLCSRFRKTPIPQDLRQTAHFSWRCKTLLYAFPWRNPGKTGIPHGQIKGSAVFRITRDSQSPRSYIWHCSSTGISRYDNSIRGYLFPFRAGGKNFQSGSG